MLVPVDEFFPTVRGKAPVTLALVAEYHLIICQVVQAEWYTDLYHFLQLPVL